MNNVELDRERIGTMDRFSHMIEINHFRIEVDEFVAMLMRAIDDV